MLSIFLTIEQEKCKQEAAALSTARSTVGVYYLFYYLLLSIAAVNEDNCLQCISKIICLPNAVFDEDIYISFPPLLKQIYLSALMRR